MSYMLNEGITPRSIFTMVSGAAICGTHTSSSRRASRRTPHDHGDGNVGSADDHGSNYQYRRMRSREQQPPPGERDQRQRDGGCLDRRFPRRIRLTTWRLAVCLDGRRLDDMTPDPITKFGSLATVPNPDTTLDFVGRNHGGRSLGNVPGLNPGRLGSTEIELLVCRWTRGNQARDGDGYPISQWGARFYSLPPY